MAFTNEEFMANLKSLLQDEFVGKITQDKNTLTVEFLDGKKFNITVNE